MSAADHNPIAIAAATTAVSAALLAVRYGVMKYTSPYDDVPATPALTTENA